MAETEINTPLPGVPGVVENNPGSPFKRTTAQVERHKIRLAIDLDEVCYDWFAGIQEVLDRDGGPKIVIDPAKTGSYNVALGHPPSDQKRIYDAASSPGLYSSLDLMPGAKEVLEDIRVNCRDFIDPFMLTAPNLYSAGQSCWSEKAFAVERDFGDWWLNRLIISRDKTRVAANFLIDDNPEITGSMDPTWEQIVYRQAWNAKMREDSDVLTFEWSDWPHLKLFLREEYDFPQP
jgi:5'-nucleotidase